MDLVFIYGPPAAGKLTVAKELSGITGYKVFDNHASLDFVGSIFERGTEEYSELVVEFRMRMLEAAAKAGISAIFTSAYVEGRKTEATHEMTERVRRHGGRVCPVYLYCEKEELLRRVTGESRKSRGKFTDPKELSEFLKTYDLSKEPFVEGSLRIDNTGIGPRDAAEAIVKHYKLPIFGKADKTRFKV